MDRKRKVALLFQSLMNKSKKRTKKEADDFEDVLSTLDVSDDDDEENADSVLVGVVSHAALAATNKSCIGPRAAAIDRTQQKEMWSFGYSTWTDAQFKARVRVSRDTFNFILDEIRPDIEKTPTNLKPTPIEAHRQLGLSLYRLAHGSDFQVIEDVFGVSKSLGIKTFNHVIRVMILRLYDRFVVLPSTEDEWKDEAKGFIENYMFPCVGAWDGFHIHVLTRLKNHYSFKHKYTITNMGFVAHNKRIMNLTCNAPGSTHDSRLLKRSKIYSDIQAGKVLPNTFLKLDGDLGEIPLVTVGDTAFAQHAWLVKAFPNTERNEKKRYFNTKLCGARVVTENCYGMLKGRWRILYRCEAKLRNVKYIIMASVMLHNLCIARHDPCNPRWKLTVDELCLIPKNVNRSENKEQSKTVSETIANWIWHHR